MGRALAEQFAEARATFEEADDVLGVGLSRLAWEGPEADLTATSNAQPALLTHSVAAFRVAQNRLGAIALAAGHSLGEFSAYVAAGAIGFADALRTVRVRGELMQRSGRDRPGTMAALLGIADDAVETLCREASIEGSVCVAANYNSPGQIVISGDVAAVERALELARAVGAKRALKLNVSGAFHSPLMDVAAPGLRQQLDDVDITRPAFPVISNVTAAQVTEPNDARRLLVEQLTAPVRWTDSMRTMLAAGVVQFYELGPGSVLSGLLRRIERSAQAQALGEPGDLTVLGA